MRQVVSVTVSYTQPPLMDSFRPAPSSSKLAFPSPSGSRILVAKMVAKMDELGFGNCTNTGACEAECPKGITLTNIARLNREYYKSTV